MTLDMLYLAIVAAQGMIALAMAFATVRLVAGPRAQDRRRARQGPAARGDHRMTHADALSPLVAAIVATLVLLGALVALVGSWGLLRLGDFYDRVHPPTMGTTMGLALVLAGSMVLFTATEGRPVLHEIVIAVFMIVTTPVTFMLLVRAARHREPGVRETRAQREAAADAAKR
jgi:multicomponent K+:H+ antiporter subunit G